MGHKVSPISFRIGYNKTWKSQGYYDRKSYGMAVSQDVALRRETKDFLKGLPIASIDIKHGQKDLVSGRESVELIIETSKTGMVLGKDDENVTLLKAKLEKLFTVKVKISVHENKRPDLSATLVADSIARQVEKRMPHRRVIKQAMQRALEKGAQGVRVKIGGRLNGAEIARVETYKEGNIPRQTIRANIDYAVERITTPTGITGLKVWIYLGDVTSLAVSE